MPPKKGKKGAKGKEKQEEEEYKPEVSEPTEKELLLQRELDDLNGKVDKLKDRVEELRHDNEVLQQEAHKVRIESHEYMSFMEKKKSKRQSTIVTLSDQNRKEIDDLIKQKNAMIEEYKEKRADLREILVKKQGLLAHTQEELRDLQGVKNLQQEQLLKIRDLEKEVLQLRGQHSHAIQELKGKFLRKKNGYKQDADAKIDAMARQANKEAQDSLNEHTTKIKLENRDLRRQLLSLIQKTRALHSHKEELLDQRRELQREQQYAQDLHKLRHSRQHKQVLDIEDEESDFALAYALKK